MEKLAPTSEAEGATTFRVAVCEAPPELASGSVEWASLCAAVAREAPDLLLLNEMPFGAWISCGTSFDETAWQRSLDLHAEGLARLDQLGARAVAGSRPRRLDGWRVNEAFVWTRDTGLRGVHTKQYFPDEEGYYESRWFQAGVRHFATTETAGLSVGFLICTELMFNEHARHYGRGGVNVLLVPRAVGSGSLRRWLVAARMAAIVSGAYVLSSNRGGGDSKGQVFGGAGWIVDPSGDVVAETSALPRSRFTASTPRPCARRSPNTPATSRSDPLSHSVPVHPSRADAAALFAGGLMILTAVSACSTDPASPTAGPTTAFFEALRAPAPLQGRDSSSDLYSGLIGDWDAEVVDHLPDGSDRRQSAEIHFAWVLEGRAIQDLWIAPARHDRLPASPTAADGNRYGTTLRVYDPKIDAWRVTWWNPVTGVENRLVGRRVGSQIVHTGADADGRLIRWVFDAVRADQFHWRGERSEDGGRTWTCDTEYFAHRRPTASRPAVEATTERRVAWTWTDRPGIETLRLVSDPAGARADGSAIVVLAGAPVSVRYRVEHDAHWRFREARIETGPPGAAHALDLHRDERGRWTIDGARRPDLEGCEDLDLMATPYTNTPPLAARPLAPGESRRLRVAWVRFPDLDVHAVEQEYTRLDSADSSGGPARYRYRNLESGFVGELTVDPDGLVIDYGPWMRR